MCIFSLAQHTKYDDQRSHAGKMDLFQGKDNSLALATSENKSDSLFVCFEKTCLFKSKIQGANSNNFIKLVKPVNMGVASFLF